jgi:hypothetical protein
LVKGWLYRILLLAALAGVMRCGTTPPPEQDHGPTMTVPTSELGGMWTGTTRVMPCDVAVQRCNAINDVTFNLSQYGSQVVGNYACAAGNMDCRHGGADSSGKIAAGSVSGNQINLAVKVPADLSDCYYNGTATPSGQADGVYVCYIGGRMIEEGVWNVTRRSSEE